MIDKTTNHYDKESLTHLASTYPLVEIGVRDRLQEIKSPLQFPYSVDINVEDKSENGVVIHQHIVMHIVLEAMVVQAVQLRIVLK